VIAALEFRKYYEKVSFEVNGQKGEYARSSSGCYFCFFSKKLNGYGCMSNILRSSEKPMEYEKEGYTWMQDERLEDIIRPERVQQIKEDQIKRIGKSK
jgi:hypothetical protein